MAACVPSFPSITGFAGFCAPNIVYSNSWLNQTSNISTTAILTSSSGGFYRVSVGGQASGGPVKIDVTVNNGATYQAESNLDNSSTIFVSQSCESFFVPSGVSINIAATIMGGSPTYDLYAVIEQLQ